MKALCFPDRLGPFYGLRGIFEALGLEQADHIYDQFDFVIFWADSREGLDYDKVVVDAILDYLEQSGYWILNRHLKTTDKDFVETCHQQAFGYGMKLDPTIWDGLLVEKSVANAFNDAKLLQGPLSPNRIHVDKVYQKLINSLTPEGYCRKHRVYIVEGQPTWVLVIDKRPEKRFQIGGVHCSSCSPHEVYSSHEITCIQRFNKLYGMDYGECDILRDFDDNRIYVVDANPTPGTYYALFGPVELESQNTPEENRLDCSTLREDIVPGLIEPFQAMLDAHVGGSGLNTSADVQDKIRIEGERKNEDRAVTIGFVPGEQYSQAAEALRRIIHHTRIPIELIVIDGATPDPYRSDVLAEVADLDYAMVIQTDRRLLPNAARNLVLKHASGQYVCLIENDVLVEHGWLTELITALEAWPADVAIPVVATAREDRRITGYSDHLHVLEPIETGHGVGLSIAPLRDLSKSAIGGRRAQVSLLHDHCVLFRRDALERLGEFDEDLNWRTGLALSLRLFELEMTAVLEPRCLVTHIPAYPPKEAEWDYFQFRWDVERAEASCKKIEQNRTLVNIDWRLDEIRTKQTIASMVQTKLELSALLPTGATVALVDEGKWAGAAKEILADYEIMPFPEKRGRFYGVPVDDEAAIVELKRQQDLGVSHILFVRWCFWWLDYYRAFHEFLQSDHHCLLANERIVVFELHRLAGNGSTSADIS